MKTTTQRTLAVVACFLLASVAQTVAIEGLQISVQCSNVVLSWPSMESETYIVQYRQTLDASSAPWQTLTNYFPAFAGTNFTIFVHSNVVQQPNCGSGGSFARTSGSRNGYASMVTAAMESNQPLAKPADGSGDAVPLALYPPGLDMSGFLVLDPSSGKWVTWSEYSASSESWNGTELDDPEPQDGGGTDPAPETGFYRVVRNDVHLFGLTNGVVLGGVVDIPIEIAVDSDDQIAGLVFYADGAPLIGAEVQGAWIMEWDTTMMPNGTYDLSAEVNFNAADSVQGTPVTVTVSNLVSFPNYFTRNFGGQMWVYAELTTLSGDYEIKMYTEETNYIGAFVGSTSDGIISFLWDLTDGGSYTFTNESFRGDFYITPAGPHPADLDPPQGTWRWFKEAGWSQDGFAIAWAMVDSTPQNEIKINSMVADGVVNILAAGGYTLSPGNVPLGDTAYRVSDGYTKTNLLNYLANPAYRNFYWFGHGSASSIAGIEPGTRISGVDLFSVLGNFAGKAGMGNGHPYRLVYIDGCETGKAKFCEQFGIPPLTANVSYFGAMGVRSRAFLGFTANATFNPAQWEFRATMLTHFFDDWLSNKPLEDCVSNATHFAFPMDSSWVIRGAKDLRRSSP